MKSEEINVDLIIFDEENPRFLGKKEQKEIFDYLIEFEDVSSLVSAIKTSGFQTIGDRIICLDNKDGTYTALEGNRRLAAFRLINDDSESKLKIDKILCDIVDKREDATYSIASKHISGIRRWPAITKKYFYAKQFENGQSINQISKYSPDSETKIKESIIGYNFIKYFYDLNNSILPSNANLLEKIDTDILDSRIFKRLKESLNLSIDPKKLTITHKDVQHKQIFDEILRKLGNALWVPSNQMPSIDTRIINKKTDWLKMVEEDTLIPGLLMKMNEYKNITVEKPEDTVNLVEPPITRPEKIRKKPGRKANGIYLIPREKSVIIKENGAHITVSKIIELVDELRFLNILEFKYSAFSMFRSLLELSLKQYSDKHKNGNYYFIDNALEGTAKGANNELLSLNLINQDQHSKFANAINVVANLNSSVHDTIDDSDRITKADKCIILNDFLIKLINE